MSSGLNCTSCRKSIVEADINRAYNIAKCKHCHSVFSFEEKATEDDIAYSKQKQRVFIPKHIHELKLSFELSFFFYWRHQLNWFLVIFAVLWNSILSLFFLATLLSKGPEIWYLSFHLLVGIGLIYYIIAHVFNKTSIIVDQRNISIKNGPIPPLLFKNLSIPIHNIDQLYVNQYVSSTTNGKAKYGFSLHLIDKQQKLLTLVRGFKTYEEARYLEQEIEAFLSLQDRPTSDEYIEVV